MNEPVNGNQQHLLNQHQLAAKLRRSRASIVSWQREGLPVARRGGPGKPTLYNLEQVLAWLEQTGRGSRVTLPPLPRGEEYRLDSPDARIPRAELLLGRVLEEGLGGIVSVLLAHGLAGEAALSAFDGLVVAAYAVLEECTGREDSLIPMDGALKLLMDDTGRAQILDFAQRLAGEIGPAHDGAAASRAAAH